MSEFASIDGAFERIGRDAVAVPITRPIAVEQPIAMEVNGIGYAVLMGSPTDLTDLAVGFALSERLADTIDDVTEVDAHEHPVGWIVRFALSARTAERVLDRIRHRTSESACGLCGVENLEQAMRPLPTVSQPFAGDHSVVFAALDKLGVSQPLNRTTGAVHAAALCGPTGDVRLVREDVGRHNAFDKLIGAMAHGRLGWDGGFALLTSRCSYELVEKAALANCPLLATISAATSLAIARAAEAGLPLISLARTDALLRAR